MSNLKNLKVMETKSNKIIMLAFAFSMFYFMGNAQTTVRPYFEIGMGTKVGDYLYYYHYVDKYGFSDYSYDKKMSQNSCLDYTISVGVDFIPIRVGVTYSYNTSNILNYNNMTFNIGAKLRGYYKTVKYVPIIQMNLGGSIDNNRTFEFGLDVVNEISITDNFYMNIICGYQRNQIYSDNAYWKMYGNFLKLQTGFTYKF